MSPRFSPDPKQSSSGFLVYPKGTYLIEVGEPKAFFGAGKNNKADNHGVGFPGKIKDSSDAPAFVGKPFPFRCFMHTDGARNFSKGIQMAVLGVRKDEEFNQKYGDLDWSYNTDDGSCGAGWHEMKGQVVRVDVDDVKMGESGDEQTGNTVFRVAE